MQKDEDQDYSVEENKVKIQKDADQDYLEGTIGEIKAFFLLISLICKVIFKVSEKIERCFEKWENRLSEKISLENCKKILNIMLLSEGIIFILSCCFSGNWIGTLREVFSCTPVGGLVNMFYSCLQSDYNSVADKISNLPNEQIFYSKFGIETQGESLYEAVWGNCQWLLSGIQELLLSWILREARRSRVNRPFQLLHSILFLYFSGIMISFFIHRLVLGENGLVTYLLTKWYIAYQLHSKMVYIFGCMIVVIGIISVILGIVALKVLILNLKYFLITILIIMLGTMAYDDFILKKCYFRVENEIGNIFDKTLTSIDQYFYATPERMYIFLAALFFISYSLIVVFRNSKEEE